jgi:flagellin FlaB
MFETINNPDEERGQVGIGTLIVFIALVLVAAIAAGVLINTAGFLQNQAESTGQESSDQVTNSVQIVSATGEVSGSGNVESANLTVALSPGADPVDLDDATVEYVGSTANTSDVTTTNTKPVYALGIDGAGTTLTNSTERAEINIDLDKLGNSDLSPGAEAEIVITTESGAQSTEVLNVPDPIGDKNAVVL